MVVWVVVVWSANGVDMEYSVIWGRVWCTNAWLKWGKVGHGLADVEAKHWCMRCRERLYLCASFVDYCTKNAELIITNNRRLVIFDSLSK